MQPRKGKMIKLERKAQQAHVVGLPWWADGKRLDEMNPKERLVALRRINLANGRPADFRNPKIAGMTTKEKLEAQREFRAARQALDRGEPMPLGLKWAWLLEGETT